ncbi:MAG TPA: PKD domain-containing protein, partial [Flavobacteriales bacterium]|nr:PKD domain-containing protein [Flavobacteriales bacterium]
VLNTVYTFGAADSIAGMVTLILTSTNINVLCLPDTDTVVVLITTLPIVNAGVPLDTACANAIYQMNGTVTGGASSGMWLALGSGTFVGGDSTTTNLTDSYDFGPQDTAGSTITFVLTSTNSCINFDDTIQIFLTTNPIADAGPDQIVCANNDTVPLAGSVTIVTNTGVWSSLTTGGVFLPDSTVLNGQYIPSPAETAAGMAILVLTSTNNQGCLAVTDTLNVTISPDPVVNAGLDLNLCFNNPDVNLAGTIFGGSSTGIWTTTGTESILPNNISLTATYIPSNSDTSVGAAPVIFVLTSTNNGTCIQTIDSMTVIWSATPEVDAGTYLPACPDSNGIQLNGLVTGGTTTGVWSTIAGTGTFLVDSTDLTGSYLPSTADEIAGSVDIILTSTNGCIAVQDTTTIVTTPLPQAAFTDNKPCNNFTVPFIDGTTISTGSIASWNWSFGDPPVPSTDTAQNPTFTYPGTGSYPVQLVVTSDKGCTDTITSLLQLTEITASYIYNGNCLSDGTVFTDSSVAPITDSIVSWSWDFGDGSLGSTQQNPSHLYGAAGVYTVTLVIQTLSGCLDTTSQAIIIDPNPVAGFTFSPASVTILQALTMLDNSTGATSWGYDFGDGSGIDSSQSPSHIYERPITFFITQYVANNFGCIDSITIDIKIADIYPPVLPLAFTPNGDGQNDLLYVRGGPFKSLVLQIYNQWGQLIYETDDVNAPWDGTRNGVDQPIGVYVYVLKATSLNDIQFEKWGDVSLLR